MTQLKFVTADTSDGMIVLTLENNAGVQFETRLSTLDAASLVSVLNTQMQEVLGSDKAESQGLPGMCRVQYVETPESILFRVFVSEHIYHEYPVPTNTDLAEELKEFADRWESRQEARATHRQPDTSSGKH